MKITPINFTSFLEPELASYWEEQSGTIGNVDIQRNHNLKLNETVVNSVQTENSKILCSIQLTKIPQQENYPAINVKIHLPQRKMPHQILMVFKTQMDPPLWTERIISYLRKNPIPVESTATETEEEAETAPPEETAE